MFLSKEELKTVSTTEIIDLITNSQDPTVTSVINECIDMMKSYLFRYYDANAAFETEGAARNLTLLRHLKSLVIADLYFIRKKTLPEGMEKRYDEAMRWLEKVSKGEIEADLPPKQEPNEDGDLENVPFMKLGSRKTYKNHW